MTGEKGMGVSLGVGCGRLAGVLVGRRRVGDGDTAGVGVSFKGVQPGRIRQATSRLRTADLFIRETLLA
jgi:hypothetical protein